MLGGFLDPDPMVRARSVQALEYFLQTGTKYNVGPDATQKTLEEAQALARERWDATLSAVKGYADRKRAEAGWD